MFAEKQFTHMNGESFLFICCVCFVIVAIAYIVLYGISITRHSPLWIVYTVIVVQIEGSDGKAAERLESHCIPTGDVVKS